MAQLRSEGDRVVHRAVVRSQPQCWDGSINENLRTSGNAGPSYLFTDLFFQSPFISDQPAIAEAASIPLRGGRMAPRCATTPRVGDAGLVANYWKALGNRATCSLQIVCKKTQGIPTSQDHTMSIVRKFLKDESGANRYRIRPDCRWHLSCNHRHGSRSWHEAQCDIHFGQ